MKLPVRSLIKGQKPVVTARGATQWLKLGFAVHPLMKNSKGWLDTYRSLDLTARLESVEADPSAWTRLGVEPGSPQGDLRWVVVDDDSHKDKYNDNQRLQVRHALWELFRKQSTNPHAEGNEQAERLSRALWKIPSIETPSGGFHYFFRYDGPSFGAMNLPGLDILCETNVATWPTEGYQIGRPFPEDPSGCFEVTQDTLRDVARMLKPLMAGALEGSLDDIRSRGRNNYARNLLWRTCMAALRVHSDINLAKDAAQHAWTEQVEALSKTLGGEDPSEWGVQPERDFQRTWGKAEASYQKMTDLGVFFDDGYLQATCRNKDGMTSQTPLIHSRIASIRNEIVLAGPPGRRSGSGVRIEDMDGTSYYIDQAKMGTHISMANAMSPLQMCKSKDAVFQGVHDTHQAIASGLLMAADGTNLVMPTGVWWRREFTPDLLELIPSSDWAFYADEVFLPSGEIDQRVSCTPVQAHQIMQASGITSHVPWKLGPDCDRKKVSEFCRTLAGFAQDDAAARAVVLPGIGLMRGWLRGSNRLGATQPFISIEGPTGAGKTTGIFEAVLTLAGVTSASGYKTQAVYSTEMTQSRCGMLVMDDQDIDASWGELLRIQQVEGAWSKANAMRHLLGTTVLVSQGLPMLENDQALQDRVFRIDVPEVRTRKSLLDSSRPQSDDLYQISREVARGIQGGWTRAVIQAMGMVDVEAAADAVWTHWAKHPRLSPRQAIVMASAELAARVYCWVANDCDPKVKWWLAPPKSLSITLEDGDVLNVVQVLRDTAEEATLVRMSASPLATALAEYLQRTPHADWDRNSEPKDHIGWCKQFPAWIRNGRLEIRVGALSRWAQQQRWPNGIRAQLFSVKQFHSELASLNATGTQNSQKFGVIYRAVPPAGTLRLLEHSLGWASADNDHLEFDEG